MQRAACGATSARQRRDELALVAQPLGHRPIGRSALDLHEAERQPGSLPRRRPRRRSSAANARRYSIGIILDERRGGRSSRRAARPAPLPVSARCRSTRRAQPLAVGGSPPARARRLASCIARTAAVRVVDIGDAARHAGGEVAADLAEHDDDAAGHVFAAMVAGALDDGDRAGVAHREALAGHAVEEGLALDRAVEARYCRRGCSPPARAALGLADDDAAARQALADIVVGVADQVERDAAGEEGAEALAGRAGEAEVDAVLGQPAWPWRRAISPAASPRPRDRRCGRQRSTRTGRPRRAPAASSIGRTRARRQRARYAADGASPGGMARAAATRSTPRAFRAPPLPFEQVDCGRSSRPSSGCRAGP